MENEYEVRKKARELYEKSSREEGFEDFSRLNLAQGFPIFSVFVQEAIRHGTASEGEKKHLLAELHEMTKHKYAGGVGARRVDFFNVKTNRQAYCYVFLDRKKPGYDLRVELARVTDLTDVAAHEGMTEQVESILNFGRAMYGKLSMKDEYELFSMAMENLPEDVRKECWGPPKVNVEDTTLYMRKGWDEVAVYIELGTV